MRSVVFTLAVFICATASASLQQRQPDAARPPNVVIVMSDDLGYGDLSSYGARDARTPNIDGLGRDGARMTDFYANGVLCSPTRAALITGRYQQRYGIENALGGEGSRGLVATNQSLPRLLKDNGYATALIGKWHLGGVADSRPGAHGFEYFFGFLGSHIDHYEHNRGRNQPDLWENDTAVQQNGYMTDLITSRAITFIEQNASRPFFIDVAYNAPHWPYQQPDKPSVAPGNARHLQPQDDPTSTRGEYVEMVERVDRGVGDILRTLDRLRLSTNTIVIFTNDNGGEWLSRNAPFFHRKWTVWEGGIRVPALVRWPGRIPAGVVSRQVGMTMDLTKSILVATGSRIPVDLEGIDLFAILEGRTSQAERTVFWRTGVGNRSQRAVRSGDWKLIVDGTHVMVFDLGSDLGERNDLANQRQDVARRLRVSLAEWERTVDADSPSTGRGGGPARGLRGRGARGGGDTVP